MIVSMVKRTLEGRTPKMVLFSVAARQLFCKCLSCVHDTIVSI